MIVLIVMFLLVTYAAYRIGHDDGFEEGRVDALGWALEQLPEIDGEA